MALCKRCESEYGDKGNPEDGLCPTCLEKEQTEEGKSAFAESNTRIDRIIKSITDEPPLAFAFINWDIKKGGTLEKLSGLAIGAAVGGVGGEMLFGGSLLAKRPYAGEFGILVVTASHIYIPHSQAPFESTKGDITPDHLQLLQTQFESNNAAIKAFPVRKTQVSRSDSGIDFVCGSETVSVHRSELYIDETPFDSPSLDDIYNRLVSNETLITPSEFADKLRSEESPISLDQFREVEDDVEYIKNLFLAVAGHKERDTLVQNFTCLPSPLQSALEEQIRSAASSIRSSLIKVIASILAVVLAGGVIAPLMFDPRDGILVRAFAVFFCSFFPFCFSVRFILNWRRTVWCRKIIESWRDK